MSTGLLETAERKLQKLGVRHAPIQEFADQPSEIDGRHVTLRDPDGIYYLLGTDGRSSTYKNLIQLIFLRVPDTADEIAAKIGWRVADHPLIPPRGPIAAGDGHPMEALSATLQPR